MREKIASTKGDPNSLSQKTEKMPIDQPMVSDVSSIPPKALEDKDKEVKPLQELKDRLDQNNTEKEFKEGEIPECEEVNKTDSQKLLTTVAIVEAFNEPPHSQEVVPEEPSEETNAADNPIKKNQFLFKITDLRNTTSPVDDRPTETNQQQTWEFPDTLKVLDKLQTEVRL